MANDKWDLRFLELARHIAQWSKDPSTKCGAVVVDDTRRVVSMGFNGFARGTDDSPEKYADRDYKLENVIHCEENAILQAGEDLAGYSIYSSAMPCSRCAARIIQCGIQTVVVPCKEEDAFFYRSSDWHASFVRSGEQLYTARVSLHVMEGTNFDCRGLMGIEHPYWAKYQQDHSAYFHYYE